MSQLKVRILPLICLAIAPIVAQAELSANLSLVSNYKFRGQDQDASKTSALKPALQGGFDYAFANGFYVGNWNSSVNWLTGNSLEMDIYGGYKGELTAGLSYDLGVLKYSYPGNTAGNTTEVYAGLGYGPFGAKYSQAISDDYFAYGSKASYLGLTYAQDLSKGLTLKASIGRTHFKDASAPPDFTDYSLGVAYDLGSGYALGAAYVGADQKASYSSANNNRLVLSISKAL
jgi:uncharacterized protein (TIGR02001 family)